MHFKEYQKKSRKTAIYSEKDKNIIYPLLGLAGETGEVVEKVKKVIRIKGHHVPEFSAEEKKEIAKELGDVLWYLAQVATELGLSLEKVAQGNIEKLFSRKDRGALHGKGDNR